MRSSLRRQEGRRASQIAALIVANLDAVADDGGDRIAVAERGRADLQAPSSKPNARHAVAWLLPLSRYRHVDPADTSVTVDDGGAVVVVVVAGGTVVVVVGGGDESSRNGPVIS